MLNAKIFKTLDENALIMLIITHNILLYPILLFNSFLAKYGYALNFYLQSSFYCSCTYSDMFIVIYQLIAFSVLWGQINFNTDGLY